MVRHIGSKIRLLWVHISGWSLRLVLGTWLTMFPRLTFVYGSKRDPGSTNRMHLLET